jgi:hypothetical protein
MNLTQSRILQLVASPNTATNLQDPYNGRAGTPALLKACEKKKALHHNNLISWNKVLVGSEKLTQAAQKFRLLWNPILHDRVDSPPFASHPEPHKSSFVQLLLLSKKMT